MRPAVAAVLIALLLVPATAFAQSSPFAPLPQAQDTQTQTTAPAQGGTGQGEGISSLQETLLIAAGIVLVLGIGLLIARDARKNAPVDSSRPDRPFDDAQVVDGVGVRRKPDPRAAQRQKAAAKRARQARKRNRPVRK